MNKWVAVDGFFASKLVVPEHIAAAQRLCDARKIPQIQVPPYLGRFLNILAPAACRVLEVGTLGGVSALWLAERGRHVTTLEINEQNAKVAAENFRGREQSIDLLVGDAKRVLPTLGPSGGWDFMFVDADKGANALYLEQGLRLVRPGGAIVVDNVVRGGGVVDSDNAAAVGTRAMFDLLEKRGDVLEWTVLQTVCAKGHDGICVIQLKQ